jgi:hypothetical protein
MSVSVCDLGTASNSHPSPHFACNTTEKSNIKFTYRHSNYSHLLYTAYFGISFACRRQVFQGNPDRRDSVLFRRNSVKNMSQVSDIVLYVACSSGWTRPTWKLLVNLVLKTNFWLGVKIGVDLHCFSLPCLLMHDNVRFKVLPVWLK